MPDYQTAANTDRELCRDGDGDGNGMSYYEPHVTVSADGLIQMHVGGYVIGKTIREWHALAAALLPEPRPHE